ncbi:MAG: STAS domain-containing protein [bacterium]|nr:STAS domain-containing protein [bacterium]
MNAKTKNDTLILSPDQNLVSDNAEKLLTFLKESINKYSDIKHVVLSGKKIDDIDVSGVNLITGLIKQMENEKKSFRIKQPGEKLSKLLSLCRLSSIIDE